MTRETLTEEGPAPRLTSPLSSARHAKHVAAKWWWWKRLDLISGTLRHMHRFKPYRYSASDHYNTFLEFPTATNRSPQTRAPKTIWCAWTGQNELTPARRAGYQSILDWNPDANIILVTPDNLHEYVVPSHPIHPIYEHLSYVHRSDYLRCYLLHHHGGAYTDLKVQRGSMSDAIDILNASDNLWIVGGKKGQFPAKIDGESALDRECRMNFDSIPCGAAFAIRANTPLTTEWYAELHRRADYFLDLARANPGGVWGLWHPNVHETDYPIQWNELQANIFEPLCLKYLAHIILEDRFRPSLENYR